MFKNILNCAHKNGIILKNGKFVNNNIEIDYPDFIMYINKNKFIYGIEGAIANSKKTLFQKNKCLDKNVK